MDRGLLMLLTFCAFILMACCAGDVDLVGGGVRCKILGQSGKIMIELIGNKTEGNFNDTNEDRLSFEVDEVKETDSQGQVVGKTGLKPHAVNSLAGQLFAFSKTDNVSYYQGMKALNVNLSAYLAGLQATLDIMVFLFLESGTVVSGNEAFSVYKGTVKFSIKIANWEFCDAALENCKKGNDTETGAFIDLTLRVKSKGTPKKGSKEDREKSKKKPICYKPIWDYTCPEVYDMGGGSDVVLIKEILIDEERVEKPEGFPKFVTKGSKKLLIFRIPRFNKNVLIDPAVNLGGSEGGGKVTSGGDTGVTGAGGSNTTGGGVSTTSSPGVEVGKETTRPDDFDGGKSSASLLPFNLCILFLLLPAAAIYTAPFNV